MNNTEVKCFINSEIFSSNLYVLSSKNWNILIDPWFYSLEVVNYIRKIWGIEWILLTHWHGDHIREVDTYTKIFPTAKIFIHKDDEELLHDTYLNCSLLVWDKEIIIQSEVQLIWEGEHTLNWLTFNLIHTPWHTDWCSMYYLKEEWILFSWDMILMDSIWTLSTPTWDIKKMQDSISKIKEFWFPLDTKVYPWHWEVMTYWDILKINPYLW